MRSMLQLLGGVAVAGAVAAGSTAFTASGLTNTVTGQTTFIGGSVTHAVTGAVMTGITFTADTTAIPTQISAFALTFTGAPDSAHVTAVDASATPGGPVGNLATGWVCTDVVSNASTCTAKDAGAVTRYYTGVSNLTIKVV
jgi:hypothetical protein